MRPVEPTSDAGDSRAGERVYFPGLDGLRAVAIALVYGFHDRLGFLEHVLREVVEGPIDWVVDPLLAAVGLPEVAQRVVPMLTWPFRVNGWVGVQIFFVLSGFLITTLLLRERERFGRVDLRAFWVRRALRIWPLYYLIVAIGFGLLPLVATAESQARSAAELPAFLVFLGNWSMIRMGPLHDAVSVLWSVCVEEQFYLFVPVFVAFLGPRWRVPVVAGLMASAVAGRYVMAASGIEGIPLRYNSLVNLDTLLAGVLLALVLHRGPASVQPGWRGRWLCRSLLIAGVVFVARVPVCEGGPWRVALDQVLIWVWAIALVILAATPGDRWTALLRRPSAVWLGKISYGLYMFHELALNLVAWLGTHLPLAREKGLVLSILGPPLTIAMAAASYHWFEQPFLRRKRAWTRVPSRPIERSDIEAIRKTSDSAAPAPAAAAAPTVNRPPQPPLLRMIVLMTGSATLMTSLAWAYACQPISSRFVRRRGPTLAEPREQVPRWVRQHEQNVSRTKNGPVPLLFLGDSITAGWLGDSLASFDKEGPRSLWDRRYRRRGAENFGVDGDQIEHLLWRIQHGELGRIEPAVVVLLIGTNNLGLDSPRQIAEGIARVVAEIQYQSPRTHVLLLGLLPRGLTLRHGLRPISDTPDPRIAEVNRLIAPLASRPHVTYLDIGGRFLSAANRIDFAIQPDYLHFTTRGYEIWADAIEPTLVSILDADKGQEPL